MKSMFKTRSVKQALHTLLAFLIAAPLFAAPAGAQPYYYAKSQASAWPSLASLQAQTDDWDSRVFQDGHRAYVDGPGGGVFVFKSGDFSAEVDLDPSHFVSFGNPNDTDEGDNGYFLLEDFIATNNINLDWGGAAGDGTTDDAAIIESWLVTASKLNACAFATKKTYLVGVGSALDITFDADLCIELHAGATLKGVTDTGAEILRVDGVTRDLSFTLRGSGDAGFDMTEFEWDGLGANEGSGLSVQRWGSVLIDGVFFNAGTDYLDGFGDTCLGSSDNYDVRIVNNRFWGCDDEGIYATGGGGLSGTDDGGSTIISNNIFRYNSGGVSVRRQGKEYLISNNEVFDGHTCIKGVEAGSSGGDLVPPPAEMQVLNNKCYRMLTRAIELRGITAATLVSGNQMHDINGEEGVWPCVNLLGTTRVRMSGNVCEQRTYDQTTSRGAAINDWIMVNGSADTNGNDGIAAASDATFTSAGVTLTSGMVGRTIRIAGAGADGANLTTTIASFTDANHVELTVAPSTSVNPALFVIAGSGDTVDNVFPAVNNYINDNDFAGVHTAIYDGSIGSGGQNGAIAVLNNFDDVVTKYSGNVESSFLEFDGDELIVGGDSLSIYRDGAGGQHILFNSLSNGNFLRGYSTDASAKGLRFDARTESGSAPSGGSLFIDFAINGTEYLKVNQDGSTVLRNTPATDAIPAAGDYPVAYNGGRMIGDPDGDKLLSFTDETWASAGFDPMNTWADGLWTLEAKRDGQTDVCGEDVSVDGGNYFFNIQSYSAPGTLTCDWRATSNDLEFWMDRSGTSDWQIKATLKNPQE